MCLRRFKQGEEIYHHPSSFLGFTAAAFGFLAAGAGAALVVPLFEPWLLVTETSKPTRL
jgi:hypothetical protein